MARHRTSLRRYTACLGFFLLNMFSGLSAAELNDFAFHATLAGNGYDEPVRTPIPQEILARTLPGFEDLRVYNDQGEEVERAVFPQYKTSPAFIAWEVVDSNILEGTICVILKRTHREGYIRDIELIFEKGMFRGEVRIFSSGDAATWRYLARANVVDLRPNMDVHHTGIVIPETLDSYIKVEARQFKAKERDPYLDVFLEQFGIDRFHGGTGNVRIKGAVSSIMVKDQLAPVYDQILFTTPETYLDDDGNTIIDLGKTGLPMDEVKLEVTDPYFFREVQLWAICEKASGTYNLEGSANIYSIDAYGMSCTRLPFEKDKCRYVRLKVLNKGRAPLSISQVALRWIRREIYFIPQQQQQYEVYFGSRHADAPGSGLADILRRHPDKWRAYAEWRTGRIEKNESYDPDRLIKKWYKALFLTGIALLVAYMLGVWIIQIRGRVPRTGPW